jgi:predicted O-linked N-acetylglucosamine transferase (SPINDLY family)/GT2 family glycosyltransferase
MQVQVLLDLHRTHEARMHLHRCLRQAPTNSDVWRLLAIAQSQRSRHCVVRRWLARALRLNPHNIEALRMQAWIELGSGEIPQAVRTVRQLLALLPQDHAAWVQAAFVFIAAGDLSLAGHFAQDAVLAGPTDPEAWRALSQVRYCQRLLEEAEHAIDTALQLDPLRIDSLRQLGWILIADQRFAHAQLAFFRVLELRPQDPVALQEAAESCLRAGDFAVGLTVIDRLLQHHPNTPAGLLLRARLLCEGAPVVADDAHEQAVMLCRRLISQAQSPDSVVPVLVRLLSLGTTSALTVLKSLPHNATLIAYRDAMGQAAIRHGFTCLQRLAARVDQAFPEDPWLTTACLYAASLDAASSAAELALHARDWYRALKLRQGLFATAAPLPGTLGAKPRIAYIASQSHQRLLVRVVACHDPAQVEVFVYTNQPLPELPGHIRREALVPERLAQSCAANRIDVVIDAGGFHPFEGQLGILECYARRLAPLQMGWLGIWGTTGGLFDVLITDHASIPDHQQQHYEEALLRLEGGQWSWEPPRHAPDPVPAPALLSGSVTFGVTARGLRLNPRSLDVFARIVASTPRARIRFIGLTSADWPLRTQITTIMAQQGVMKGRIAFDPSRSYEGLLEWFKGIDLVLDTFPGNGGLSLLDSLWMEVPVLTLAGQWAGARQGCSVLTALGLPQWVADSEESYLKLATTLGQDVRALQRLRTGLRSRLLASALTDGHRLARQIERAVTAWLPVCREQVGADPKARIKAQAKHMLLAWLDKETHLVFPDVPTTQVPDLSVLLVLYNQAGLSRKTLQAVADQRGPSFETIIVDNASSDETDVLLRRIHGAHVIRNVDNRGFLLAANQAAALARGRHVVLVNSDAIVQKGALAAAVNLLDSDPTVGAVGGRIVLTSGGLQEAGNVVFCDGSTLGVGRGEDPFSPAAMARRATDYVSGVFMAVPTPLWRMLGGFDEAFAPAYYEDTDLCLRIWKAGWRVVYEPSILVEHLEWGSASHNDEAPRQMQANRTRFLALHADELVEKTGPTLVPLGADRWRSPQDKPRKPRVLILDNEVPHMHKGGGLPRARLMLHALTDWPVTFFPLWGFEDDWREVYASLPRSVEVMLGYGLPRLEEFLEQRRGVYDVLVVSRPPNLNAIQPLRARRPELFRTMRLIYDAEALFALREIAEAAVRGRPWSRDAAQARIAAETQLAVGAEQVLVVSERDARYFRQAGHRVTLLGHALDVRRDVPPLTDRNGLLFVGALHPNTPNEDGLLWFIDEVMPRLARLVSEVPELQVVGVCRSARVLERTGPNVRILGPQERLEPFYDATRVFVAPVRFAGGVPLKVIEAAAQLRLCWCVNWGGWMGWKYKVPVMRMPLLAPQRGCCATTCAGRGNNTPHGSGAQWHTTRRNLCAMFSVHLKHLSPP